MKKKNTGMSGQSVQLLFTMLLFFALGISALFTILFGAQIYQNIGERMDENFSEVTALSYVANQVRQADQTGMIDVVEMEDTSVLRLQQTFNDQIYETLIYYQDGALKELFTSAGSGLSLSDGIEIMESEGMNLEMLPGDLLHVVSQGENGGSLYLALRSGGGRLE